MGGEKNDNRKKDKGSPFLTFEFRVGGGKFLLPPLPRPLLDTPLTPIANLWLKRRGTQFLAGFECLEEGPSSTEPRACSLPFAITAAVESPLSLAAEFAAAQHQ